MRQADIVVLGGSAAGLAAAFTARRHYPDKSIILVRKEDQVLIPCGIPYIFGTLGTPQKNLIPDAGLHQNRVDGRQNGDAGKECGIAAGSRGKDLFLPFFIFTILYFYFFL